MRLSPGTTAFLVILLAILSILSTMFALTYMIYYR